MDANSSLSYPDLLQLCEALFSPFFSTFADAASEFGRRQITTSNLFSTVSLFWPPRSSLNTSMSFPTHPSFVNLSETVIQRSGPSSPSQPDSQESQESSLARQISERSYAELMASSDSSQPKSDDPPAMQDIDASAESSQDSNVSSIPTDRSCREETSNMEVDTPSSSQQARYLLRTPQKRSLRSTEPFPAKRNRTRKDENAGSIHRCNICDMDFARKDSLNRHFLSKKHATMSADQNPTVPPPRRDSNE